MSVDKKASQNSPHHVLDFLVDDSDSCALTVRTEDNVRMHIIADSDKLKKASESGQSNTYNEFVKLVAAFRKSSEEGQTGSGHDSGVDVSERTAGEDKSDHESSEDAEDALQSWMLGPVRRRVTKQAQPTLGAWYDAETQFHELEISKKDELVAVELEESSELKRRMAKLKPEITLPKYIREMHVPWFDPAQLTVLAASGSPPPYHPTEVRCKSTGKKYFFKAVDSLAPQSTKRELWHLSRIAKADLADQIRAPRLVGLVSTGNSKTHAIGFLQSDIPNPTPLTEKLDAEVPQEKRDAWAAEAERMKDILHEHKIVWGDAKADNFLVDDQDTLWIIDFGGSWTEGWIDPEMKETVEGDDMATEKITNALHDPVHNVWDPSEESKSEQSDRDAKPHPRLGIKRKASEEMQPEENEHQEEDSDGGAKQRKADEEEENSTTRTATPSAEQGTEPSVFPTPQKKRKSEQVGSQEVVRYCYCDSPSAGPMIGCDSPDCERQWFHFYCAGIKESPPEDVAWFCKDCSKG